jgi:DNA phosphorothioation-dependent restriction protein DptG
VRQYSLKDYCEFISSLEVIVLKPPIQLEVSKIVEVNWADRWQVYQRLQELAIPCCCDTNQPLRVHIDDVAAAVQFWSVLRQLTTPRQDLVRWLERCWQ